LFWAITIFDKIVIDKIIIVTIICNVLLSFVMLILIIRIVVENLFYPRIGTNLHKLSSCPLKKHFDLLFQILSYYNLEL
jgi:hypothetical protein